MKNEVLKQSTLIDFAKERNWQAWSSYEGIPIPTYRVKDLLDEGSLTQQLIKRSQGAFQVRVLAHSWGAPNKSERLALSSSLSADDNKVSTEEAIIREVELQCQQEVWVIARSVIPKSFVKDDFAFIEHLGDQPLGEVLFSDSNLQRTSFEVCYFEECNAWGRRSVFLLRNQPLLVAEIFLPLCPALHDK